MHLDVLAGFVAFVVAAAGPNNLMLMTSGVKFGFGRPHLAGVVLGFSLGDRGETKTTDASAPSLQDIQAAYDKAAALAGELHDKDLKIVGVDCHPGTGAKFYCQVGFVKTEYDPARVFLDAALVERNASRDWTLLRGLCRRLL